jgi:hypothetical protein
VCAHCTIKRKGQGFPCYCYEDIVGLVSNEFYGPEITEEKEEEGQSLATRILDDMRGTDEVDSIWGSVWTCACCSVLTIGGERDSHHVSYFPEKIVEVHPYCHSQLTAHKVRPDLWPPEGDYEKFYHPPPIARVKVPKPTTTGSRGRRRTPPSRLRAIWTRDHGL